MNPLATFISPGKSIDQAIERVKLAEKLGYDAVYATQIAARDGLMTLAAYAPHTSRIKLGTGVLPAFGKHPVALAYEAATLDEISGGRLILGIGMAHRITMENWYGIDMARRPGGPHDDFGEGLYFTQSFETALKYRDTRSSTDSGVSNQRTSILSTIANASSKDPDQALR